MLPSGIQWIPIRNALASKIAKRSTQASEANLGSRQNLKFPPNLIPRVELRQTTREINEGPARPEQEWPEPGSLTTDTSTREAAWGGGLPAPPYWAEGRGRESLGLSQARPHVRITQKSNSSHDETKLGLTEEQLRERFLQPYELGEPIIINGKSIPKDVSIKSEFLVVQRVSRG